MLVKKTRGQKRSEKRARKREAAEQQSTAHAEEPSKPINEPQAEQQTSTGKETRSVLFLRLSSHSECEIALNLLVCSLFSWPCFSFKFSSNAKLTDLVPSCLKSVAAYLECEEYGKF